MMRRRAFLAATAGLAAPAIAQKARVLRFVPNVDLPVLDPVANTAAQVRNHAFLVFDTLYGLDDDFAPRPQMLEGHATAADGLLWTLRLREGLRFHDGSPVLARDCVASIRRWGSVDGFGALLLAASDALEAADDRTIRFRLKRPFPLLPDALGKVSPNICPMMPERLAMLPGSKPVPELVGSGPFRLVEAERVPGSRIVYERFADYYHMTYQVLVSRAPATATLVRVAPGACQRGRKGGRARRRDRCLARWAERPAVREISRIGRCRSPQPSS